jgi:hypothetical protein
MSQYSSSGVFGLPNAVFVGSNPANSMGYFSVFFGVNSGQNALWGVTISILSDAKFYLRKYQRI